MPLPNIIYRKLAPATAVCACHGERRPVVTWTVTQRSPEGFGYEGRGSVALCNEGMRDALSDLSEDDRESAADSVSDSSEVSDGQETDQLWEPAPTSIEYPPEREQLMRWRRESLLMLAESEAFGLADFPDGQTKAQIIDRMSVIDPRLR